MFKLTRNIAIISAIGLLAAPALADFSSPAMPVHLTRVAGYYSGGGGEFTLTPGLTLDNLVTTGTASDIPGGSWQSFCLEKNEYVTFPGDYYADINTFATLGGVGGIDGQEGPGGASSDSLDDRTAYLYENFRNGTLLTTYAYGGSRSSDAGALQDAMWYIEGEISSISGDAVTFYNEAVEATEIGTLYDGSATDGLVTWTGLGNVRVLNMWGDTARTQFKQDLMVLVPMPGAALLGVIGLAGIGWIKRRIS